MKVFKAEYFGRNYEDESISVQLIIVAPDLTTAETMFNKSDVTDDIPEEQREKVEYKEIDLTIPHVANINFINLS